MTDNEIIKALECCIADKCMECPLRKIPKVKGCMNRLSFALDLINRQKAENERLQKECEITRAYIHNNGLEWGLVSHLEFYKNQRAEAIREFAERLKERNKIYCINAEDVKEMDFVIDNLVKEMENETK